MRGAQARRWAAFVLRRLVALVVVTFVLVFLTFMLVRWIPGDPAVVVAGPDANEAQLALIRSSLGLDRPPLEQFTTYITHVVRGDLGLSFFSREPVARIIGQRVGTSVQLAAVSLALVLLVAIPGGMLVAHLTRDGRHRRGEVAFTAVTSVVGSDE